MPATFLEKQLLAVHTTLTEEIAEEKRKIAQLLSRLRQLHSQLSPEALQQLAALRQQSRPASAASGEQEECRREEAKRDGQLEEIARLRDLCAELRARLEHDTVIFQSIAKAAAAAVEHPQEPLAMAPTDANGSLLVTRF